LHSIGKYAIVFSTAPGSYRAVSGQNDSADSLCVFKETYHWTLPGTQSAISMLGFAREAMYEVLIVDDELPIREELQLFAFGELRCEICGQAENGSKALEFIVSNPVDIVITDIRMPVMDGLQLIEKTKERFPNMQFILLSCINDFEPIKHALKMGVVDYILKGAYADEELAAAIKKAVSNIEERKKILIEHLKDEYLNAARFLSRLVQRDEEISEAALNRLRELGVIGDFPFSIAWINFCTNPDETAILTEELKSEYVSSPEFMDGITMYFIPPGGCLLFLDRVIDTRSELYSALEGKMVLLDTLYRRTKRHSAVKALRRNYLLPKPIRTGRDLPDFLTKLESFREWGFYIDQGAICEDTVICGSLHDIDTESIRKRFSSVPIEEFSRFIEIEFRAFLLEIHIMKTELFDFVSELVEDYLSSRLKENRMKELTIGIHASDSLDGLLHGISAHLQKLRSENKFNKYITRAMLFINQDLARPLSLSIVAEEIGLSASYLSSLFYRETAKQFNEYITEKRMLKAMNLLRESSYKVYEVSEMVGIPSYRYFSKLFKEYTGQNPSDFK
jgi:two-component system response regulator YesN